jgi:predicted DNA-binding protein (UPF0251 family)
VTSLSAHEVNPLARLQDARLPLAGRIRDRAQRGPLPQLRPRRAGDAPPTGCERRDHRGRAPARLRVRPARVGSDRHLQARGEARRRRPSLARRARRPPSRRQALPPVTWSALPPHVRELAERACTRSELEALKLWDPGRVGYRTVAAQLGISTSTVRDRIQRGLTKIGREAERVGLDLR